MDSEISLLEQAFLALKAGDLVVAKSIYEKVLSINPEQVQALDRLGIILAQEKAYKKAQRLLEQAVKLSPNSPDIYNHLGNVYKSLTLFNKAIQVFNQAILLKPDYSEAYNNLGNVYYLQGDIKEAINQYKIASNLSTSYFDALQNLILCYLQLNNVPEVYFYLKKLIEADPNNSFAHYYLGDLALKNQDFLTAENYYELVLKQEPYHIKALINLAVVKLQLKKMTEAKINFQLALEVEPENLIAHHNLAAVFFNEGQYEQAKNHYFYLLNDPAENYNANFQLGLIFMKQKKWEQALSHFNEILKMNDADPLALLNYGTIQIKLTHPSEGIQAFEKVLAIDPDNQIARFRLLMLKGDGQPNEAPRDYIENLFDDYAENFDVDLMERLNYRLPEALYSAAKPYLAEHKKYLMVDLGCGTGLNARLFSKHASFFWGIDLSHKMLKIAASKGYYDELIHDDMIAGLEDISSQVDFIFAADVLVYQGELSSIFHHVYEKLTNGGLFIFSVERGFEADYTLQKTGRFCHRLTYLQHLAKEHHFKILSDELISLRKQHGDEVLRYLLVLQKIEY